LAKNRGLYYLFPREYGKGGVNYVVILKMHINAHFPKFTVILINKTHILQLCHILGLHLQV